MLVMLMTSLVTHFTNSWYRLAYMKVQPILCLASADLSNTSFGHQLSECLHLQSFKISSFNAHAGLSFFLMSRYFKEKREIKQL